MAVAEARIAEQLGGPPRLAGGLASASGAASGRPRCSAQGNRMRQAGIQPRILVRFSGAGGRPPDTRHGKDWTAKHTVSLVPSPKLRVSGTGNKTQTPSGSFSRCPGAPLPTPSMDGTILKSHRCWSSGTAPRCMSCVSPGLEETGQRALPRCKTGPSRRQGDGRGEEPQRQSSWLARGVLERGVVISRHWEGCRGGRGGGAPGASLLHFVAVSYFKWNPVCYRIFPETHLHELQSDLVLWMDSNALRPLPASSPDI